jgi:hypothetical protein
MLTIAAKFAVTLVMFAQPEAVTNAAMTLTPTQTIEFRNTTEKNTAADCARVAKALNASHIIAYCGEVEALTLPVATK